MCPDEEYMKDREEFFTEPIPIISDDPEYLTMSRALLEDYKRFAVQDALQNMDLEDWLELGYKLGIAGPLVCSTHDGVPMTLDEEHEFETGGDPCIFVVRPYDSLEEKVEVEKNHSPSVWRARGWDFS